MTPSRKRRCSTGTESGANSEESSQFEIVEPLVVETGGARYVYTGWCKEIRSERGVEVFRHGMGRNECSNGDIYEGEYEMDQRHGYGKVTFRQGYYDGEWWHGMRQGTGFWHSGSEESYFGSWIAGKRDGHGTQCWLEMGLPCSFEGNWKGGFRHGEGMLRKGGLSQPAVYDMDVLINHDNDPEVLLSHFDASPESIRGWASNEILSFEGHLIASGRNDDVAVLGGIKKLSHDGLFEAFDYAHESVISGDGKEPLAEFNLRWDAPVPEGIQRIILHARRRAGEGFVLGAKVIQTYLRMMQTAYRAHMPPECHNVEVIQNDARLHAGEDVENFEAKSGAASALQVIVEPDNIKDSNELDTYDLSAEQKEVLDLVETGQNIFFTGCAGTGKSFLVRCVVKRLFQLYGEYNVGVSASTGIAATHIQGTTLHSLLGCSIPKHDEDFRRIRTTARVERLRALVIDEISMVSGEFFDKVSGELTAARRDPRPFGGIQLVLTGDFFQLPPIEELVPVPKGADVESYLRSHPSVRRRFLARGLAFQSDCWARLDLQCVVLRENFRARDPAFNALLARCRVGQATEADARLLNRSLPARAAGFQSARARLAECRAEEAGGGGADLLIVPHGGSAERHNRQAVDELPGDKWTFVSIDSDCIPDGTSACVAPAKVDLKIGTQVMLLRNLDLESKDLQLSNGSLGRVVGFASFEDGGRAAEALAAHGRALDERREGAELRCGQAREGGDEEAARRAGDEAARLGMRAEEVRDQIRWMREKRRKGLPGLPVVLFANGREETILPRRFSADAPGVHRTQLPLKGASAITIHKSQGMSLARAKVDVCGCWEPGQSYVALSRLQTAAGLRLLRPVTVDDLNRTNPLVVDFYADVEARAAAQRLRRQPPRPRPSFLLWLPAQFRFVSSPVASVARGDSWKQCGSPRAWSPCSCGSTAVEAAATAK